MPLYRRRFISAALLGLALCGGRSRAASSTDPIVFADFEGEDYGNWKTEGDAFGSGPASGSLPGQMPVTGFRGHGLANSFHGGDSSRGRLISPSFTIAHRYIAFLIGGGGHAGKTCINLVVDGIAVRTATGENTEPGGSELLEPDGWDVRELRGKNAHLEIIDDASEGWGHITVDQIEFTDKRPPIAAPLMTNVVRAFPEAGRWLNFPIRNGAPKRIVTVRLDGRVVRQAEIPLADGAADWWAPMDVGEWRGKSLSVTVDRLAADSQALRQVTTGDAITDHRSLYHEELRPQFHFSAQRGWLNDPNGMAYFKGEYHLFFQHSPFTWDSSLKYWGHAVSTDLVHWTEVEEALYPDALGDIWSGSGVVDVENTSGFGTTANPPLVFLYTAAKHPFVQCVAYTTDGRHVTKFADNPVVPNVTAGNRDPRVFWYAPEKHWVMALYVEVDKRHTVHFFRSKDLKEWQLTGVTESEPGSNYLYECPDIFELPLDGDPAKKQWILAGADSQYAIGHYDGQRFLPETPPLPGHHGRGFYAAQTFSNAPDNRCIQIGWLQTETRGMPFNQSMSLPLELRLITTADGPRLTWTPVQELESLRERAHALGPISLASGAADPGAGIHGELFEIRAEFTPGEDSEIAFQIRGVPVVYHARKQELRVNGLTAPAPLRSGKQRLTIYADRTGLEVFASDGLTFVPMPVNLSKTEQGISVAVSGAAVEFDRLDVYELRSAWR